MTQHGFSRRRFLNIAAALPLAGMSGRAMAAAPAARWHGVALGASSQIVLSGVSDAEAAPLFAQVRDEIARLEGIFSLHQNHSDLSRLNAAGCLDHPAPELLEVLSLSRSVWQASFGAFDPSVQPLWRARAAGGLPATRAQTFSDLTFSSQAVALRPGMALTFNGIAQGYITDRVAGLLRRAGLVDLIVDAGEQRAWGGRPGGGAWRVGISNPAGVILQEVSLRDRALATSSPRGTLLPDGAGHIIDARSGKSAQHWNTISLFHESAALADALSTAACCLTAAETDAMLRHFPEAELALRA
ncbi:FAD:protein FMN transferase [Roseobacter denitrificans]|uniref:FAD:protein FMN transferase n=1 Tax=Roseobacter denitrificans (strain ATCC 33942 / OCh 114) TaxID=375451 RepID=Q16A12_ROSDO|nr:FAD:protein FMN transferase [Roseobacter denitrificans]ABG31181.1 nitrous-oxide reductase protein nosX, putative [Roseobacter denitrificans OCh 114]AVL54240.1 FAD:protein FMN transferase [Roseobacter denitrificans]SFF97668.1 thiamine biosynthesis lipoprotein [Roseobacter denitrificans OCh 114]